jgi:Na+-translocating membrane potential-generating system MpsC-like protein
MTPARLTAPVSAAPVSAAQGEQSKARHERWCPEQGLQPLVGGRLLAEITNRVVALMRKHYGRGPIKAKPYVLDNLIVCVLSDGFTAIERTMVEGGRTQPTCLTRAVSFSG